MSNRLALRTIPVLVGIGLVLAGCGTTASPKTSSVPQAQTNPSSSTPTTSTVPSSSPSPSSTSSAPTTSSTPSITTSAAPTNTETPPVPPGAGAYTSLGIHVTSVTAEGTSTSSGKNLAVYRIGLSLYNPTSSVVTLTLNDFTVDPTGSTAYSWNDYVTTGISSGTSLFPYPLHPEHPGASTINVFPDATDKGYVTIQVSAASRYQLTWNTGSTSPQPQASFKP